MIFHDLRLTLPWDALRLLVLRGRPLMTVNKVRQISEERAVAEGANQSLMLLRVLANDDSRSYFVDFEHGRTNVREVSSHLVTRRDVLAWLLPGGYVERQGGDVAFYETGYP